MPEITDAEIEAAFEGYFTAIRNGEPNRKRAIQAALFAYRAALAEAGFKIVAREPSDAMDMAAWQFERETGLVNWRRAWRAMWDAAP